MSAWDEAGRELTNAADALERAARAVAHAAAEAPEVGGDRSLDYGERATMTGRPQKLTVAAKFAQYIAEESRQVRGMVSATETGEQVKDA